MALYAAPRLLPAGDGAVSVELADEISREANARALTLERLLLAARLPGLVDTVPTFRSLLVHYDPLVLPWATLRAQLLELSGRLADAPPAPGAPGGAARAPTAASTVPISRRSPAASASTPAEVVALHAGAEHYVYFVGFTPGLPYMAGQPARLTIPRLDRPADQDSRRQRRDRRNPDLHLLGGEPGRLLAARPDAAPPLRSRGAAEPILLRAGDHVRFRPIEPAEFEAIAAASRPGRTAPASRHEA